jgi:hypothetical protein
MAPKKRSPKKSVGSRFIFFGSLFAAVFVAGVLYLVLPKPGPTKPEENPAELKARLATERGKRKRELQDELSDWEMKNDQLRREIERLKTKP